MSKKNPAPMIRRRHAGAIQREPNVQGPKIPRRVKKAMGKLPPLEDPRPPLEAPRPPQGANEVWKMLAAWGRIALAGVRKHILRESPQGAG